MVKGSTEEVAKCFNNTSTVASPAAMEQLPLNGDNPSSPRYQHNTSSSSRAATHRKLQRLSVASTPCQVLDNFTEFRRVFAFTATPTNDFTKTGCSLSTAVTLLNSTTTQSGITHGTDGDKSLEDLNRGSSDKALDATSLVDSTKANQMLSVEPETTGHCCTTSTLPSLSGTAEDLEGSTVVTVSTSAATTEFVSHATKGEYGRADTTANPAVSGTYSEDYASNNNHNNNNNNNNSLLRSTVLPNYKSVTTEMETRSIIWTSPVVSDLARNRTFNFVFDGNCAALKQRGPEAVRRFRSVVVDALSSGLSLGEDRLVAGELRCGSLNLSVTLLNADDDDVRWVMSTLADATLRVSVEDVDEVFVLLRVELAPRGGEVTGLMSGHIATTNRPSLNHASVAILVVFVIIGVLAVIAGTVSAAVYLYFRRMYCRTFVVNRRALRWSSRASDTVQVIGVDDDDTSSGGGGASSRAAANDAVEWSPPISGSGFGEDRLPVSFANWSPHYCQARFRRLIAPPPSTLTSLPDEEAAVGITSENSFHPCRRSSTINLLQASPADRELHNKSTDNDGPVRHEDCRRGILKQDTGLTGGIAFDWTAQDFLTDSNKERATPF